MPTKFRSPLLALLAWSWLLACAPAWAAEVVGSVASLRGEVTARQPDGSLRTLAVGAEVYLKDQFETGAAATMTIKFADDTRASMGEKTRLAISEFRFAEHRSNFALEVAFGLFRVVTGLIGKLKPEAVAVKLPVGAIGIRGTDFAGEVTGTSALVVLLDPDDSGRKTAIEVSNEYGRVVIDEANHGTEIPDAFSPPSPPRLMRLRSIEGLMRSLQSIQRIPRALGR